MGKLNERIHSCIGLTTAVRKVLIDDPEFIFPLSMQQVTLYRSMQAKSQFHIDKAKSQMRVSPDISTAAEILHY